MFKTVSPESAGISSKQVLNFIKTLESYHFCTHSFIMARGEKIFAEGYYAPYHKDSKQRMYSISKSFVGVAIGLAVEDGLLSLEDKFVTFFPEYLNEHSNELLKEMTIRDMLTMSTCIDKPVCWFNTDTQDRCEVYFRTPAGRVSGTIFEYDSPGSFMLGAIVEKLTKKPFLEYMKDKFLVEAGFSKDAYCLKCPGGHSFGDSGVICTARDLLLFARFVMNLGTIDGVRYLNEEYLKDATSALVSNNRTDGVSYGGYGYGYQIWKAPNDGFAFVGMGDQFAICDREKDLIFIITCDNQGRSPSTRAILYHELYKSIVEQLGEPMEENEKDYTELKDHIAKLELFCLTGKKTSSWAQKINGKTYVLDSNPMEMEYVHFQIENDEGILTYKNAQGIKKLPFGFGKNVFAKFPQENYSDMVTNVPEEGNLYDCAVSADWPQEQKLRLKVQIIDKYLGNMSMEFGFKDDRVGIYMSKTAEAFLKEYEGYASGRLMK